MKTEIFGIEIEGNLAEEIKGNRAAEMRADELRIARGGRRQNDGSVWDAVNKISSRKGRACCGINIKFLRHE